MKKSWKRTSTFIWLFMYRAKKSWKLIWLQLLKGKNLTHYCSLFICKMKVDCFIRCMERCLWTCIQVSNIQWIWEYLSQSSWIQIDTNIPTIINNQAKHPIELAKKHTRTHVKEIKAPVQSNKYTFMWVCNLELEFAKTLNLLRVPRMRQAVRHFPIISIVFLQSVF